MDPGKNCDEILIELRQRYPEKFASEDTIFSHIHRGDKIFVATACAEPQYLVNALIRFVEKHPKAVVDAEVFHIWTLGVAPYTDEKFKRNFRHNSFFIGGSAREAVNQGAADFTPISLSEIPDLIYGGLVPLDVALIQTSLPDAHGYMSLGISVDIVKAAVEKSRTVIAQVNAAVPRVHGDGFIHVEDVDFLVPHDEPLLEYEDHADAEIVEAIGKHVAQLIQDGDTLQVGYGSLPDLIMPRLGNKRHLGVHSELIGNGIIALMKNGVVNNTKKTLNRGKTVATFCMGTRETYEYLHDNPLFEFRTVDFTNNPLIIARQQNMTAINSALQIDLTGQATSDSLGKKFYSGVGGLAGFMRGAALAPNGKTILLIPSTAQNGEISRVVPTLTEGTGVTLIRSDIQYVITEHGIVYLKGKNIRERAMALISIAHPKFRPWLIEEAKKRNLIYRDQAFIPGKRGEYPEALEIYRTTYKGIEIFLRPVKISDEPLMKDFFYDLSERSLHYRFMSERKDMPHERLQDFVVVDYSKETTILAFLKQDKKEELLGVGQYYINESTHTAEVAFAVKDEHQGKGVGQELLHYLTFLAKKQGLVGFTAEVMVDNQKMLHVFQKMGFDMSRRIGSGVYELTMGFRN
ncbi:MAG: GNAT family N-acetyltransferase [Deltaproteobacteria bacterium]|nr:GNAT family N-acetyltransferase [Deltaproteobacteria bacterium]